jgi:transcriptional regulator with XRE-family HTH domain
VSTFFLTPRQIRAARGLVGWTQGDLAEAVGLSRSTIAGIENETANTTQDVITRVRQVLESNRVEFLSQEGVRVRHPAISEDDAPDANKRLLNDIYVVALDFKLKTGSSDILIFGLREEDAQNSVGDDYLHDHLERLKEAGLHEKILCGPDTATFVAPRSSYRRLAELGPSQNTVHIYGNKVALVHWRPKEFVIILESEPMASSLRSMFYHIWNAQRGIDGGDS